MPRQDLRCLLCEPFPFQKSKCVCYNRIGLRAIQPKTYLPKTSDGRADQPSPNLLLDQPRPAKPDQVWAGDITFIPTSAGWLYLAVVIDLCPRKIAGWSLADPLRADLVIVALQQA